MDLWTRAKEVIAQGNQLLSKRSEIYPPYYDQAKGVNVWDLEGNKYIDMATMGIGTCILGYANDDVDFAVIDGINKGSMSSLNCYEEIVLAEIMLKIHPWANMVRYARTGGEAMAIAVRIARAYTGKDKIAFSGYHGWHDWYLSANLSDNSNLNVHLLPQLGCAGVPKCLKETSIPFEYNNIEQLEAIVEKHDIGVIVIETMRHEYPKDFFLQKVRKIADEIGAVLIFDEITIGFRMCFGGAHLYFNAEPDIAVFGKAISNGYPMSVVIGKESVMEAIEKTFISSTYWTERIGLIAAIETITKMNRINLSKYLHTIGKFTREGLEELGFQVHPPNSFLHVEIPNLDTFKKKMLKRGYLAGNQIYLSHAHTEEIIENYLKTVESIL